MQRCVKCSDVYSAGTSQLSFLFRLLDPSFPSYFVLAVSSFGNRSLIPSSLELSSVYIRLVMSCLEMLFYSSISKMVFYGNGALQTTPKQQLERSEVQLFFLEGLKNGWLRKNAV